MDKKAKPSKPKQNDEQSAPAKPITEAKPNSTAGDKEAGTASPAAQVMMPSDPQLISVEVTVGAETVTDAMRAQMKSDLAGQSPTLRAALRQALDEIDGEASQPETPATRANAVDVLEAFTVKFNGQKFALQKGGRVANPEFAHFLQEGTFPVKPVRQKGADA